MFSCFICKAWKPCCHWLLATSHVVVKAQTRVYTTFLSVRGTLFGEAITDKAPLDPSRQNYHYDGKVLF